MKRIIWNVRVAGRKGFYSQVKDLISKYNLDMLALTETRVNATRALKNIKGINLSN